jgi:DNA-binding response OmpR family regulator
VLVVEDEPDVAELIRHHLSRDGDDVVVGVTGAAVLLHARDGRVDAGLLDIMVPQLNGWEVCRRLKQEDPGHPRHHGHGTGGGRVDVHLARLRAKFVQAQVASPGVETVRGIGYRFREPA